MYFDRDPIIYSNKNKIDEKSSEHINTLNGINSFDVNETLALE